jgi:hypothetical protein
MDVQPFGGWGRTWTAANHFGEFSRLVQRWEQEGGFEVQAIVRDAVLRDQILVRRIIALAPPVPTWSSVAAQLKASLSGSPHPGLAALLRSYDHILTLLADRRVSFNPRTPVPGTDLTFGQLLALVRRYALVIPASIVTLLRGITLDETLDLVDQEELIRNRLRCEGGSDHPHPLLEFVMRLLERIRLREPLDASEPLPHLPGVTLREAVSLAREALTVYRRLRLPGMSAVDPLLDQLILSCQQLMAPPRGRSRRPLPPIPTREGREGPGGPR